jgi:uncharacterized protein
MFDEGFFFLSCGIIVDMDDQVFYSDGLRFSCTQCSRCCRHDSGYVFLSRQDLTRLLNRLEMDEEEFIQDFCVTVPDGFGNQISLGEQENKDCIFWSDGGCSVYEDRPEQCRTYPFWSHVLESEESWNREARECPGIGIGRLHSFLDIRNSVAARVRNRPVRRG